MFGINQQGNTCSITINDYQPFFFVKVGDSWSQADANGLLLYIKGRLYNLADGLLSCKIVDYNKLYGFTGGRKSRFCLLRFQNMETFRKTKNLWYTYENEKRIQSVLNSY